MSYQEVLQFWFDEIAPAKWWAKDQGFDDLVKDRFFDLHARANRCELYPWRQSALGRLAEILVLDQFSRNIFRNQPQSFASDPLALALAQEAISAGAHNVLALPQQKFLYMPFMHSESRLIHRVAVSLFSVDGLQDSLNFELKHKKIIDSYGRYPHRNEILGRVSTEAEMAFLQQPGSRF